ncbi:MAG: hypothetical protein HOO96_39860 [Polyangiaceae bacterium]|nr:hypothetical protein [Polyangiaceae bacterium]
MIRRSLTLALLLLAVGCTTTTVETAGNGPSASSSSSSGAPEGPSETPPAPAGKVWTKATTLPRGELRGIDCWDDTAVFVASSQGFLSFEGGGWSTIKDGDFRAISGTRTSVYGAGAGVLVYSENRKDFYDASRDIITGYGTTIASLSASPTGVWMGGENISNGGLSRCALLFFSPQGATPDNVPRMCGFTNPVTHVAALGSSSVFAIAGTSAYQGDAGSSELKFASSFDSWEGLIALGSDGLAPMGLFADKLRTSRVEISLPRGYVNMEKLNNRVVLVGNKGAVLDVDLNKPTAPVATDIGPATNEDLVSVCATPSTFWVASKSALYSYPRK